MEPDIWGCEYNFLEPSCHHAANIGVEGGNEGIVSCTGAKSGPYGHTVVYDRPIDGLVCIGEPQSPGSTACCFNQSVQDGPPDLSGPEAQECLEEMCGDQYDPKNPPCALPPGEEWPTDYLHCSELHPDDQGACEECCNHNADEIPDYWGPDAVEDRENYRAECLAQCRNVKPPAPPAEPVTETHTRVVYQPAG